MSNFTIDIEKQLSKLGKDIQQFVEKIAPAETANGHFSPDCDITESSSTFSVMMDLPGMKKKQIKIELKDRVMTVSGERELYLEDGEKRKKAERKFGSFSRSFAIPQSADESSISATFSNGVLHISLNKTGEEDEESSKSIPIS
ncbi:MAG: Hsp20/alpha crystallin family protein [Balneolaceae bacterium]|nr:Hsp20/alpha crystallin family protein [Balneolaceae bacterium]